MWSETEEVDFFCDEREVWTLFHKTGGLKKGRVEDEGRGFGLNSRQVVSGGGILRDINCR